MIARFFNQFLPVMSVSIWKGRFVERREVRTRISWENIFAIDDLSKKYQNSLGSIDTVHTVCNQSLIWLIFILWHIFMSIGFIGDGFIDWIWYHWKFIDQSWILNLINEHVKQKLFEILRYFRDFVTWAVGLIHFCRGIKKMDLSSTKNNFGDTLNLIDIFSTNYFPVH